MSITEKLSILIDAKTGGAVKEFDKVAKSTKDIEDGTSKASKKLEGLGISGKVNGAALAAGVAAGATAAAGAIAKFAANSISHFNDTAQSVRAFQRVTGQSAEDASHFVSAFDDMNISADTASTAMFKLAKNIGAGGGALGDLGIEIAKNKDGSADLQETFLNIADAVSKTSDPAERASIAFEAFGKQGANLLPILEKGRAGIEKLFKGADLNFTQAQLDSAEDYRLAMDHLGDSVGKVQNRLGALLVPALAKAADGTALLVDGTLNAIDHNSTLETGVGILGGTLLNVAAGPLGFAVEGLGMLAGNSDDSKVSMETAAAASGFLGTSLEDLAGKTQGEVDALVAEKKALDDVYSATLAQFDANFAYQDSLNATEDAAAKVAEAQKKLNDETKLHGTNSAEAKAASEELSRVLLAQQEQALQSATAAGRVAEETAKMAGATDTTVPKIEAQIAELERQKSQVDGRNVPAIQNMIDHLNAIKSQYVTNIEVNGTGTATAQLTGLQRLLGNLTGTNHQIPVTVTGAPLPKTSGPSNRQSLYPGRAAGGPVVAGSAYIVGENHPELFVPDQNGTIVPRVPGGGGVTINVYAGMGTDGASVGRQVAEALKEHERRGGQVPWAN